MNRKIELFIFLALIVMAAISCKTLDSLNDLIDINGMIYDYANRPVPYCDILLNGEHSGSTDVNGRFTLQKITAGTYNIDINKSGYESCSEELTINDTRQIVYIRMPALNQLLGLADDALAGGDLTAAEEYASRAYMINDTTAEALFYCAVIKFRQNKYSEAIKFLESAGSPIRDMYVEKFLNILTELTNDKE